MTALKRFLAKNRDAMGCMMSVASVGLIAALGIAAVGIAGSLSEKGVLSRSPDIARIVDEHALRLADRMEDMKAIGHALSVDPDLRRPGLLAAKRLKLYADLLYHDTPGADLADLDRSMLRPDEDLASNQVISDAILDLNFQKIMLIESTVALNRVIFAIEDGHGINSAIALFDRSLTNLGPLTEGIGVSLQQLEADIEQQAHAGMTMRP